MSEIDFDSVTLEKLPYRMQQHLDAAFLHGCTLETFQDAILGGLIVRLETAVLTEKLADRVTEVHVEDEKTVTFDFPASWWQHLKLSWLGWASAKRVFFRVPWLRRQLLRPTVRWTTETKRVGFEKTVMVTVEQLATFPHSPIRTPPKYQGDKVVRYERLVVQP